MAATMISVDSLKENERVRTYIAKANDQLGAIGYTEHGERHASLVSKIAYNILQRLEKGDRTAQLAAISGYLHDIGNVINREGHAQLGALLAHSILHDMGMDLDEITEVVGAIGNHHEEDGNPVSAVAAALILADKSDVHKTRVRNPDMVKFDIHDRVNYAAQSSFLRVNDKGRTLALELTIDPQISSVMEYFEIFLSRMVISRRAANYLGCKFELIINGSRMI
jgi:metal-dependent HD superfamily phosphatase/phosphodiesterase